MEEVKLKKCSGECELEKLETEIFFEFRKDNNKFRDQCRICVSKRRKTYYEKNRNSILEEKKDYYKNNLEVITEYNKIYSSEHKQEKALYNEKYWLEHKEELSIKSKQYRIDNIEKVLEQDKKSYERNKKNKIKAGVKYQKNKRKTDPNFKCKKDVSRQISIMLNKLGSSKDGYSCWGKLPYEPKDLMDHLEKQFSNPENLTPDGKVWMTRYNRGIYKVSEWNEKDPNTWKWHIDHIDPHSSFPYDSYDHPNFLKAWDLSNLRPFKADLNIKKGNKVIKK